MVDYSKWDQMSLSDDEGEVRPGKPRVTTLKQASTITLDKGKWSSTNTNSTNPAPGPQRIVTTTATATTTITATTTTKRDLNYSKWDSIGDDDSEEEGDGENQYYEDELYAEREEKHREEEAKARATQTKKVVGKTAVSASTKQQEFMDRICRNGSKGTLQDCDYFWSQTKSDVVMHFVVPKGTKGKDVGVKVEREDEAEKDGVVQTNDLAGSKLHRLTINLHGKKLVSCPFAYIISEVAEDELELEWEMRDWAGHGERLIKVTVQKDQMMMDGHRVIVWWKKCFEGQPDVDLTKVEGRNLSNQKQTQANWVEAQRMFREKVQKIKPVYI